MSEIARIKKLDLTATMRSIDYDSMMPSDLGLIDIKFTAVADMRLLEELIELVDRHTKEPA